MLSWIQVYPQKVGITENIHILRVPGKSDCAKYIPSFNNAQ